jgi:predicted ABC-type ATPase
VGYQVIMVLIHLESTDLNQARIASRVSEGGHSVPACVHDHQRLV